MQLEIVQAGDPVLRQVARPLHADEIRSAEIQQTIADMLETLRLAPGVGLAAPQIGLGVQLAIIEDREQYQSFVDQRTVTRSRTRTGRVPCAHQS